MKLKDAVEGMTINNSKSYFCEICALGKQTNMHNREPNIQATYPFELAFTDLAGPIVPIPKHGYKYVISFTDNYSGCLFTYFLRPKPDTIHATEKFLIDIVPYGKVKTFSFKNDEIFPSGHVSRIRSDNGGEYISREFQELQRKYCIKHEHTSPYSPLFTAERNW